jgi:hypothetical protein
MKHNAGSRRSRNRNGPKRQGGGGGRNNYESNGPDVKVRGTAQQVLEKYLALARDAASAGDRIRSESYYQYAEHYFRIVNADGNANNNPAQGRRDGPGYDHNPNFSNESDGEFDQEISGSGPQPDLPRGDAFAADDDSDDDEAAAPQVSDTGGNGGVHAQREEEPASGRIDESVLPAAVPTAPRRWRSRGKSEDSGGEAAGEAEAVQA